MQINLPVILITAHDDVVTQQQSLSDGAANYLRKPLRGDVLVRSINESIARAAARSARPEARAHIGPKGDWKWRVPLANVAS